MHKKEPNPGLTWIRAPKRAFFVTLPLLCSCGGGTGSTTALTALQEMQASTNQLVSEFSPIEYTEFSAIPTSGVVAYQGFVAGQLSNTTDDVTDSLNGTLLVFVDFEATEMVTGSANNFLDDAGHALLGEITLSGGTVNRAGDPNVDATFSFDGTGDLTDANSQTISLTTVFTGDFLGDTYQGVGGDVQGQAIVDGTPQSFGGLFIVSQ
ncbi:hypothetical protein [Yoonia sp. SDW83-1]|uniref:hypothetical protein n=1 Tax=Yoonia sp. SDW83-1 TaxID=3366945 RepID=UPI00398C33FC